MEECHLLENVNKVLEEALKLSNPSNILNSLLGKLHIEQIIEFKPNESSFLCNIKIPECQITKSGIGFSKTEAKGCASHSVLFEILSNSPFAFRALNEMDSIILKNKKSQTKKTPNCEI